MNKHLLTLCITITTLSCLGMNKPESELILSSQDQLQRKSEKKHVILNILHDSLAKKFENSGTVNNYNSNTKRQPEKRLHRQPQYANAQLFIIPRGTLSTRVYLSGNTTNNNNNDDSITKFGLDVD
jgi:hypothetical protein